MLKNQLLVPDGFVLIETDKVMKSGNIEFYPFRWVAKRRCEELNQGRDWPTYRYQVDKASKQQRRLFGRFSRWAVVPYYNKLEKIEEVTESTSLPSDPPAPTAEN